MVVLGHGGLDIIRLLVGNVVHLVKKKRSVCTAVCDGFVLKMHYQWTFWVFLAGFSSVWYSWYNRDVIVCVSHFNADTQVRVDFINICLSYPYIQENEDQERRYLLFYKWIHWSLLVLAGCYYIPRKISKRSENPRIKKLIEDLCVLSVRYDSSDKDQVERAAKYLTYNLKTHNGIYFKFVTCNIVALIIDILSFQFLNFVFDGRFLYYGWMAYPFNREPEIFTDYMSRTFPPFAKCEIGIDQKVIGMRTEIFGCHLTIMEFYEKVFLFIWLWLIILTIVTSLYLVFLGFMWLPYFRLMLLRVAKPPNAKGSVSDTVMKVLQYCKIGDVYVLYRFRQHLSHTRFYELLQRLENPEASKIMAKDPTERMVHPKFHPEKNRIPSMMVPGMMRPKGMQINPNDLYKLAD